MANFLTPTIQVVDKQTHSTVYQVEITPTISYRVTVTGQAPVFEEWVSQFTVEEGNPFFPVGVAVHGEGPRGAEVLTVCTKLRCIVFNLGSSHSLSRNVLVFLRDVCTCYGWRTDSYSELLMLRNQRLFLGRLTDIRSLVPPQPDTGLGFFSFLVHRALVPEPSADWTASSRSARMNQILETVMQATICLEVGGFCCSHAPPPNDSLPRVLSSTFPQINRTEDMADRTLYQVTINDNQSLHVTYTNRASVLNEWLRSPETMRINDDFIGIELTMDIRGSSTVMALAARNDCLVYGLSEGRDGLSPEILAIGEGRDSKLVGWHTRYHRSNLKKAKLTVSNTRLLDIKDGFPVTHTYDDLSRIYLGYEMSRVSFAWSSPDEEDMMALAVQAFVYLRRAMDLHANDEDD